MKVIPYKRKRQGKTDYLARKNLLKSNSQRLIVRKTNKYIIAQIVESKEAEDKVLFGVNSKELLKSGWSNEAKNSLKSIPAAYFTGLLLGKKTEGKIKKLVIDFGLNRSIQGNRLYAVIKGINDMKIEINCDESMFPKKEIIDGKNMKHKINFTEIKNQITK